MSLVPTDRAAGQRRRLRYAVAAGLLGTTILTGGFVAGFDPQAGYAAPTTEPSNANLPAAANPSG